MTPDASWRTRALTLTVAWVVVLGLMLLVGQLLTGPLESSVGGWDDDVERWLADHRTGGLDTAASVGTFLANTVFGLALGVVVAVAVSVWQRSLRPALYVVVLLAGAFALYVACTQLVPRDRPPVRILDPGLVPDHSFPSGHTITSVVVYGGTALLLAHLAPAARRWLVVLLLVPPVVAASRLYQGAHHPTDVLTALVLASVWLAVVARVLLPLVEPRSTSTDEARRGSVPA
ncbi:phosphatase PAP2 family protein [Nocardioides rubriscoriae]|uniref:phosphatase PAP2 family protein n=1 Tax=Nocardioides rubriscoriae TaxID=642762 RepID=UPI0011E04F08|nr:phosphatase PAP2 family protein [Nocardioides rubriscoriae]